MNKHPKTSESDTPPERPHSSLVPRVVAVLVTGMILVWIVGAIVMRRQTATNRKDGRGPTGRNLGSWQDPDSGTASLGVVDPDSPVGRFVRLRQENDPRALELLGPAPVFDDNPVEEAQAEEMQVDSFLRSPSLKMLQALPGVPNNRGRQKPKVGYFTLVTKGSVSSPPQRIRNGDVVGLPSQLNMSNPDLVVEVRDGKLYGRKAEVPLR